MVIPDISIIIPIYKTEKYLKECLLSVQRQTMPNFEAILVNDCTPDGAMQIAQDFAHIDPRFRILEHEVNKGLGCARNTGMAAAKGKYLNFLDSDDRLPLDSLEVLYELAEIQQADMAIGNMAWLFQHRLSPVSYIDHRIRSWETFCLDNLRMLPENAYYSGSVANRLFKKQLVDENNIQFPSQVYFEDLPFSVETWHYSKRITSTIRFVYFHTRRDDPDNPSITQTYDEKAFLDRDIVIQKIFDFSWQNTNAARIGAVTLLRILATSKEMLSSVDKDIKLKISAKWFPFHVLQINNMVNELNRVNKELLQKK